MSDDDSDSDGSGGGMTPEEAAEAQKWMSSWRLEMEGALAGASRAQEAASAASESVEKAIVGIDRDHEYAARSIELALCRFEGASVALEQLPTPRLMIALLIKRPSLEPLKTFVLYHCHLGVQRFMFFFDDADGSADGNTGTDAPAANDAAAELLQASSEWCPEAEVVVERCGVEWWKATERTSEIWSDAKAHWGQYLWSDVIARQVLALEFAVQSSLGKSDWLIHIDPDEALVFNGNSKHDSESAASAVSESSSQSREIPSKENSSRGSASRFFAGMPEALDEVVFLNHEAAPESDTIGDWFKEVSLFKLNPACGGREQFVAYNNGKAAVRIFDGVVPAGSHRFTSLNRARKIQSRCVTPIASSDDDSALTAAAPQLDASSGRKSISGGSTGNGRIQGPCLLHYVNCGFDEWRRKYESLGTFGDKYCGDTEIPFEFHLQSRDMIAAATAAAVAATAVAAATTAAVTVASAAVGTASAAAVVAAAASAAVATTAADCATITTDESACTVDDVGENSLEAPSPKTKDSEPPLPTPPPTERVVMPEVTAPPTVSIGNSQQNVASTNESNKHDAQLRSAYRQTMVWSADAVSPALEAGSVDRTLRVIDAVLAAAL